MKIAVQGCAHGDLERIYDTVSYIEEKEQIKVDVLICCGDFQATRNRHDLQSMAVPPKYRNMCSFYKYYSGEKIAPVLTLFIGGNHEASNHLQELPYGGWVAPNIYYLGLAGVVRVNGLRIAGLSGIYKSHDYMLGRYERPPYNEESKRSIYHVRNLEVFRLKQLKQPIDIFITHDWPTGVHKFGDVSSLLKFKPHFKRDIDHNNLGSKPAEELLYLLKPKFWFSAHLHCKFTAIVPHKEDQGKTTKFLALDKCLPKRKFLQVLDVECEANVTAGTEDGRVVLEYDVEWLAVLHFTNHLVSYKKLPNFLPNKDFQKNNIRWDFTPTDVELDFIKAKMSNDFVIPENFVRTVPPYVPGESPVAQPPPSPNPQTQAFTQRLGIRDIFEEVLSLDGNIATDSASPRISSSPNFGGRFSSFIESDLGNGSSSSSDEQDSQLNNSTRLNTSQSWDSDTPSPMRSSLTLPPPKNSQTVDDGSPAKRSLSPPSAELSDSKTSSGEMVDEGCFIIDTIPFSTPLTHKKFKRRNEDLYKSTDNDSPS